MRRILLLIAVLVPISLLSQDNILGGCEINFDLFGNDTICDSAEPFPLPPVLPLGGVYSGTNVVDGVFDPQGLLPGEYVITYSVESETCTGSDDVVITVIAASGFEIVGEMEICIGDSAKVTSQPSVEITWEDGEKNFERTFYLDSTFVSTASGIDESGCLYVDDFTIRVYQLPDTVTISGTQEACEGGEATLSINTDFYFIWFNETSDPTVTFPVTVDSTYSLLIYTGGVCDTTIYYTVDVVPLPTLVVEADTSLCLGDTTYIYFSGAEYYKDQFGTITSPLIVNPDSDFTYLIEGYNGLDCFVTQPVELMVHDIPTLAITGVEDICAGDSILIAASGTDNYTWLDLDSGLDLTQSPADTLALTPSQTLHLALTGTSIYDCSYTSNIDVVVNPMPELAIENLTPFCDGEIVMLLATGADNFNWSTGDQDSLYQFVGDEDFSFMLYGATDFGCADSLPYDVVIHPVPVVTTSGDLNICEGESTQLVAFGADFYFWNDVLEGDTVVVFPVADSTFLVQGVTEFGCEDFSNVNVIVRPAPDVFFTGDPEICFGESTIITVSSNGDVIWSDGNLELTITVTPEADSTYTLISTGSNGCTWLGEFPVTVRPLPVLNIDGDDQVCAGEQITLIASGATQYVWNIGNETDTIHIVPLTSLNYYVEGTSEYGCISELDFPITVNPAPYAYFEFSETEICDYGPALSWVANPAGGVLSGDGVTNNWFNTEDAVVGLNVVTYTVTNEFNCTATASDELTVDDCSGIDEADGIRTKLYPNPVADMLYISSRENANLRIYNHAGMLVESINAVSGTRLDVSAYASGIFHVEFIFQDGSTEQVKFVKL